MSALLLFKRQHRAPTARWLATLIRAWKRCQMTFKSLWMPELLLPTFPDYSISQFYGGLKIRWWIHAVEAYLSAAHTLWSMGFHYKFPQHTSGVTQLLLEFVSFASSLRHIGTWSGLKIRRRKKAHGGGFPKTLGNKCVYSHICSLFLVFIPPDSSGCVCSNVHSSASMEEPKTPEPVCTERGHTELLRAVKHLQSKAWSCTEESLFSNNLILKALH